MDNDNKTYFRHHYWEMPIVIYLFLSKYFVQGVVDSAVK